MSLYLGENLISGVATPVEPSRNIGQIIQSTLPLTDAGLHLLDGSLILGGGIYQGFVDYIADLYTENPSANYFTTEALWQTAVTTYGVCGKFVYDSVNNTVRLPKYSNRIYTGGGTAPVVGNGMTLGLTNGTTKYGLGTAGSGSVSGYGRYYTGAYGSDVGSETSGSVPANGIGLGVTTDTNKSGLIAQLSNITTSLDGYYYIVVATSSKTDIQVDIDNIVTDLNDKADIDLSNVIRLSKTFSKLIMTDVMPDWSAVTTLPLGTNNTISRKGWIIMRNTEYNSMLDGYINGRYIYHQYGSYGQWEEYNTLAIMVDVNDVVYLSGGELLFLPCKGVTNA